MRCDASELQGEGAQVPYLRSLLASGQGPIVAATDYVRAVPEQVRAYVPPGRSFTTLGTDGFGRSDTRAALRAYFEVDAASVVRAARHALTTLKIS
jgi:pyruvate dehydrogenase E1 component